MKTMENQMVKTLMGLVVNEFNNQSNESVVMADYTAIAKLIKLCLRDKDRSVLSPHASEEERKAFDEIDHSNTFDKLLVCAAMLAGDGYGPEELETLGTKYYPPYLEWQLGLKDDYSNPYDMSWFDEESSFNHKDCMQYVRDWYSRSEENRKIFAEYYKVAKELHLTESKAWNLSMLIWE